MLAMKLEAWLASTGTKDVEFARRIGVSRVTLFRFKTGRRIPDRESMAAIASETEGAVTPNDFFDLAPAEAS